LQLSISAVLPGTVVDGQHVPTTAVANSVSHDG
jgi:hypothetical protein